MGAAVDNVCSVDSNLYGQGLTPAGRQVITGYKVSDAVCAIGKLFSATSETFCPLVPMFDGPYVKLSGSCKIWDRVAISRQLFLFLKHGLRVSGVLFGSPHPKMTLNTRSPCLRKRNNCRDMATPH